MSDDGCQTIVGKSGRPEENSVKSVRDKIVIKSIVRKVIE